MEVGEWRMVSAGELIAGWWTKFVSAGDDLHVRALDNVFHTNIIIQNGLHLNVVSGTCGTDAGPEAKGTSNRRDVM